jgi:RNA polymerase sigma factor (sigma-70 family)
LKFLKLFRTDRRENLSDADYILAFQQTGDLRLLGQLYQPYMEMVFTVCYKYLRDEDECKDAVMQIFEKLVNDLQNHAVENFKSWLHTVAVNHCLMKIRAKKVFIGVDEVPDSYEADGEHIREQAIQIDRNLSVLEDCMKTLKTEQRLSIRLFFNEEKCYRQITDETGFDYNQIKSYIQNGKRNLKICMEKNGSI